MIPHILVVFYFTIVVESKAYETVWVSFDIM